MEDAARRPLQSLPTIVCLGLTLVSVAWQQDVPLPGFSVKPPPLVEFSNSTGARIPCSASNTNPPSEIKWIAGDGSTIVPILRLREVFPDGTLVLLPFKAEEFRQDVHATTYKCSIQNQIGTIVSNEVTVKAVVLQPYDVYVYDVFTVRGNTAVMRCHVPNFLSQYVTVSSWIRDNVIVISAGEIDTSSKYMVMPNGDLYVSDIDGDDGKSSFQCQFTNRLTGESKKSVTSGKFFITDPQGNMPPKITLTTKIITSKQGEMAFLPCESQGYPIPSNSWAKKSANGEADLIFNDRIKQMSGSLIIEDVQQSDSGVYRCISSNFAGREQIEIRLIINEQLRVGLDPSIIKVDAGKPATLTCKINGNPVNSITWLKDGQSLLLSDLEIRSNISIHIASASAAHVGIYQCLVKNDIDSDFALARLTLGDVPPLLISGFEERILQSGPSLNLQCIFTGNPTPRISWLLDDLPITSDKRIQQTSSVVDGNISGNLLLRQIKTQDGGIYACKADSKSGTAKHNRRINIYGKLGSRAQSTIHVVNLENVILNCPFYGFPYADIRWEKDEQLLPYDIRQLLLPNGSLVIQEVQRNADSGEYKCFVNQNGNTVQSEVHLSVLVPPKLAPFSFQDELVREGMRGRLQCVVLEGDLPISLTWLKDGQPISSSLGVNIRAIDEFSSILTIASISPRHNGNYTCMANNPAAAVSFTAQLAVNVAPKIIPFSFQDSGIVQGVLARVSCVIYQGDVPIKISWFKDGKPIESVTGVIVRSIDDYSSILTIENTKENHAGNYTCIAANAASTVAHSAQLTVNVPPKIVPFSFQDEHLLEGMLVRVSCVVSRGDLPLTITWLKDGKPIPASLAVSIRDFDEYSSVISIEPVTSKHNGNYTCVARNHAATASHTSELKIQVPPKWEVAPQDVTVKSGETAYLHCKATGLPLPKIVWMWAKGGKSQNRSPVTPNANITILKNGTVILKSTRKEQQGIYFCTASNIVGQRLSKAATLSILAPPSFVQRKQDILGRKGGNLTLSCSSFGDLPIDFVWTYGNSIVNPLKDQRYVTTINELKVDSLVVSNLSINWLDRKDSVIYKCQAENKYGTDEMEFQVTVQEIPDAPTVHFDHNKNQSVELSWEQSYNGNSPITNYIVQYKKQIDNWHTRMMNFTVPGDIAKVNVTGLQPSTSYEFRVAAQNNMGIGAFSDVVLATTEEGVPTGAPQNVEVESTDQETLRVTWKPPKKIHWNGAIRGYHIGFKVKGSADPFVYNSLEVPEDYTEDLIYQLSNLKMFTQYSVTVQAYNAKGKGPASEPSVAMTSEDVPSSPPQGVRCSALSSRSIYILWESPPLDKLNGILRGFKVLYKPVSEWYDSSTQRKIVQTTKITLQDLEVNTNYTVQILAFTKVGDGVKNDPVFCKTHEDVPEAPQDIKVLPSSSDSVVVAWKSPKNSNGGITKYNVYYKTFMDGHSVDPVSDGGDSVALMTEQVTQDASRHTSHSDNQFLEVKGLKKNKKYAFWVTASSIIGEGPSSKVMAQTVADNIVRSLSTLGGPKRSYLQCFSNTVAKDLASSLKRNFPAKSASFDGSIKTPWKKDVVLPCKAVGVPQPQRKWMMGTKTLEASGRNVLLSDGTLLINKVSIEDSGNYTCTIYNEHGNDEIKYVLFVQVPPAAPLLETVSKGRAAIELQWKPGPDGGEKVRGYILYFRHDNGPWETKELRPDHFTYTLDNLVCGATYQLYMEAFNNIGPGAPCDMISVSTEGTDLISTSKDSLLREGSTFVTVHLESFPSGGCPINNYQVEYKKLYDQEWILVSDSIRPTQRKLVIPGLTSATWYSLRLTAVTSGKNNVLEYNFGTHMPSGGTIPPPEIKIEEHSETVYLFYLDPYIFIPAVALLIVVIIASVVICVCIKRKSGSVGSPSDSGSTLNTWPRTMRHSSYGQSSQYPTMPHRGSKDPSPYATARLPEFFTQHPNTVAFVDHSVYPQFWEGTLSRRPVNQTTPAIPESMPHSNFRNECVQQSCNSGRTGIEETTFVFPDSENPGLTPTRGKARPDEDYDQPPIGI